ncbi:trafficking protein particle complex subunit 6A isoform X7 [Pseudorca crassidens]|uniref:trafficking protein particle complex subunit 6A isoform X7 n=1 Tax=Pseudorca crassidens TaxID=82174 RepID=UPI00352EC7B1
MEMLEDPETGKKQREGRRCLSRAANIDKAGPPPSLPSSGAHHKSPEKKGGASPKHQWKREWAGSRLGAGGGACPAGPMRTRGAGRLLRREGRRMADAALFEFLHTEMVAELWAQDPDPGPGGQKMSLSVLEGMGFRVGQALGERGPTSCRTTASPFSSGWPRVCSTWRKRPSSWPSPAASYGAPSAPWASRAWSPPPWQPCPPVSSRW